MKNKRKAAPLGEEQRGKEEQGNKGTNNIPQTKMFDEAALVARALWLFKYHPDKDCVEAVKLPIPREKRTSPRKVLKWAAETARRKTTGNELCFFSGTVEEYTRNFYDRIHGDTNAPLTINEIGGTWN